MKEKGRRRYNVFQKVRHPGSRQQRRPRPRRLPLLVPTLE